MNGDNRCKKDLVQSASRITFKSNAIINSDIPLIIFISWVLLPWRACESTGSHHPRTFSRESSSYDWHTVTGSGFWLQQTKIALRNLNRRKKGRSYGLSKRYILVTKHVRYESELCLTENASHQWLLTKKNRDFFWDCFAITSWPWQLSRWLLFDVRWVCYSKVFLF